MQTDSPLHGLAPMFLLLKATVKKQVWVPQFTKKNGQVVGGHYAHVHVTDDHDHHKVAGGQGSYSQKKAHAQLADEPEFHALPVEDKAALVMHHATQIQDAESQAARIATLRKKLLAGGKPTPGEWKAFHTATPEKQQAVTEAVHAAGHGAHMDSLYADYVASAPPAPAEPAADPAPPGGKSPEPKATADLPPPPKPAPQAADAGKPARTVMVMGKPKANKPASLDEAKAAFNAKHEGWGTPTFTDAHGTEYWVLATGATNAKGEINAHLASKELGQLQANGFVPKQMSDYVDPAAIKSPKAEAAAAAQLATGLAVPEFEEGKTTTSVKAHYEKTAGKIIELAHAGDVAALEALPNPEKGNSWKGKTGNSKALLALHAAALAHAKGEKPEAPAAASTADAEAPKGDPKAELVAQMAAAGFEAKVNPSMGVVLAGPGGAMKQYANLKQAGNAALALHAKGFDAEVIGKYPYAVKIHKQKAVAAPAADTGPKEGDTKEGEAGTLVLKDGHWVLQAEGSQAAAYLKQSLDTTTTVMEAAKEWQDANPGHDSILAHTLDEMGYAGYADALGLNQVADDTPTDGAHAAQVAAATAEPDDDKAMQALVAAFEAAKVPTENTNAKVFNPKVDQIIAAAQAGDTGALLAMSYGTNTYGKKAAKLANEALAFLGTRHQVAPGQKAGAHPKLKVVSIKQNPPAAAAPAPEPAAAPALAADGPVPPAADSLNPTAQGALAQAQAAFSAGDIAKLEILDATTDGLYAFQSTNTYIKEAIAHLNKQAGLEPAAAPVPAPADDAVMQGWIDAIGQGKAPTKQQAEAMETLKLSNPDAYEDAASEAQAAYATGPGGIDMPDEYMAVESMKKVSELHASALAGGEQGPENGDTKEGSDGMLVFQDGRWHKMGTDPKVLKQKAASVPVPKMKGTNSIKLAKTIKQLKAIAETEGAEGLAKAVKVNEEAGTVKVLGYSTISYEKQMSYGPAAFQFAQYVKQLHDAMAGTKGSGVPSAAPAAAPSAPGAPAPAATVTVNKTEKVGKITAMMADSWEQTGPQKGSNPGGKFKDAKGQEWYCKFPNDPDTVKNELLAAKFYQMLGADVPELRLVKKDGKLGIASKWVDGIQKVDAATLAKADGAHAGFVFDAWLANWDVVGLSNDNLMVDQAGRALRVDVGGSLLYRAQGGPKGSAFGETVPELDTLLDPSTNGNSAAVFAGMTPEAMMAGAKQLAKMHPNQIDKLCRTFGPGSRAEQQALAAKLAARREFILKKMGVDDPWNAPPPDITKLPVNPEDMPPPIDFTNYMGTGKGLSSKPLLNQMNSLDDAALISFAKQGNLKALQDYHYDAYDKETGAFLGKKPIGQHPNKDIKNHHASLCDLLTALAHPPVEGLDLPPIGGGSIEEVAEQAGAIKPGENIKTITADKVVGFWMKLGHVGADAVKDLVPEKTSYLKSDFVAKASKWYQKASTATKALVNAIQNSGTANRYWNNGDKTISINTHGHQYSGGAQSLANTIYNEAFEFEGGETVGRWMNLPDSMKQQLLKEGAGLVFQNADSMCTSIFKDWGDNAKFGSGAYLNIRFAKGAKAMASLGSGRFSGDAKDAEGNYVSNGGGEMEVTTLMGQRFVVLEVKKGNASSANGITVELLALPPHDGYVAELGAMAALGKSFHQATAAMRKQVVVFVKQNAK